MSDTKHPNVHAAILAVMKEVGYVQKTGKASAAVGGYKFAGEADLIQALRPSFVENGLIMIPVKSVVSGADQYPSKDGKIQNHVILIQTYEIIHADSGTRQTIEVLGEGADIGDKAASKAMTGALKYALRQSCLIETGNDPDNTPSTDLERGQNNNHPQDKNKSVFDEWVKAVADAWDHGRLLQLRQTYIAKRGKQFTEAQISTLDKAFQQTWARTQGDEPYPTDLEGVSP